MDERHRRLGERIRVLAEREGIVLTHLPDRAGVSQWHFFEVLAGTRSPTLRWLGLVADALGVEFVELLDEGQDAPPAPRRRPRGPRPGTPRRRRTPSS